jgi:hypothetical protein
LPRPGRPQAVRVLEGIEQRRGSLGPSEHIRQNRVSFKLADSEYRIEPAHSTRRGFDELVEEIAQPAAAASFGKVRRLSSSCTLATKIAPSPTAEATRLTEP